ncbi:nucleotidyltransferase domain-containing protein [Candidatus Woesearchaeota archaeon]|nr:nucleotidyltransferase domain-containing protein [Candidatus Woesearchaeota archaeon]
MAKRKTPASHKKKKASSKQPQTRPAAHEQPREAPDAKRTDLLENLPAGMPAASKKRLEDIKAMLDKFQKKALAKFEDYVMGLALLPPTKAEDVEREEERKLTKAETEELEKQVNVLLLVDDGDSKKLSKEELKEKLSAVFGKMAKEVDKHLAPKTIILSELWQSCYDAKYDLVRVIAMAAPVYDKGMLAAIKIADVHKEMVLKKFEKYIVSYVLAGSLVQGRATPQSDIDVFIVVDDTDVKKMTRAELKDKLRAIIISMGFEAGKMTGIENKLNVQVYILTDFWDNIKEANPIIFTFLRDGIPFYDRGIFMPWKQLLQMGRIKPSPEAIDLFMSTGEQMVDRIKAKLRDIATEDFFYATLTPSQAALMLYGVPPPTPKETPALLRELLVKKERIFPEAQVKFLERVIKVRKDFEHGARKSVTGKELDELLDGSDRYLKQLKELFRKIDELKEKETVLDAYDAIATAVRDVLRFEGVTEAKDEDLAGSFKNYLVDKGVLAAKTERQLHDVIKAKKDYDDGKLTKAEAQTAKKTGRELLKTLVEHLQRARGRELERARIRVKHGDRYGEVLLLGKEAYIIHDLDHEEKEVSVAEIAEDGSLQKVRATTIEELEHALARVDIPAKTFIKQPIFDDLLKIFGKDVEILVNY